MWPHRRRIHGCEVLQYARLFKNSQLRYGLAAVCCHRHNNYAAGSSLMRMAKKTATEAKLDPEVAKKSFRIGLISAIGPAMGVFIVMVGLMAAIGGPMAWLRLSIIGAAPTELTAATYGAQASGVELGGEGYGLTAMAVSWFAMALNGAGWLIFTGLFTPSLERLRERMSGGDTKMAYRSFRRMFTRYFWLS